MGKIDEELVKQTFDNWVQNTAGLMVGVSHMRSLEFIDKEEADDMLARISAVMMQGVRAMGIPVKDDFAGFMEGLLELHGGIVKNGKSMISMLKEKYEKGA